MNLSSFVQFAQHLELDNIPPTHHKIVQMNLVCYLYVKHHTRALQY